MRPGEMSWSENGLHQSHGPTSAVGVSVTRNRRARHTRRSGSPAALVQTSTDSCTRGMRASTSFERMFDGSTAGERRERRCRRQARSSSVRAPKTISSQLGIEARPLFEPRAEPTGRSPLAAPECACGGPGSRRLAGRPRGAGGGVSATGAGASGGALGRSVSKPAASRSPRRRRSASSRSAVSPSVCFGSSARLIAARATAGSTSRVGEVRQRSRCGAVSKSPWSVSSNVKAPLSKRDSSASGPDGAQAGDEPALELALLRERHRFGVQRMQRLLPRLESPAGVVVDGVGGELELDDPAALLVLPARPAFTLGTELREPVADDAAEGGGVVGRVGVGGDVHRHGERRGDHVFAFGEHRTLEAADVVDGRTGDLGDVFGGQPERMWACTSRGEGFGPVWFRAAPGGCEIGGPRRSRSGSVRHRRTLRATRRSRLRLP